MVTTPHPAHSILPIPPLENGDSAGADLSVRLSRSEFERCYQAMPQVKKAELIEGVTYMASPLRIRSHGEPHGLLMTWLGTYCAFTPGLILGDSPTVRLDPDNEPQPDAVLFIPGRQAIVGADDYIEGAPELIIEITASSASIDLHDKKWAYCRNSVQEYLVWRTLDGQFDWFRLQADGYVPLVVGDRDLIQSQIFPRVWLAVSALLAGDMPTVLLSLQEGLKSPAHQEFKRTLP